ncbi:MAG: deoxyguanosinetriphosphate triphosphohydrolase [Firmicutes bacterium]|nr:deoxyguanosinetriphosphate triphosphohydrolase [Bacillota bacterium]
MQIRQDIEKLEKEKLSPEATLSSESRGRVREEPQCPFRTVFQRDRDRIIHSKAFRRLKHKTQVFIAPEGDHYRTRLTHTLEVSQIARTIARALRLNEDLTEAIALGHDLGHTPFGHAGEMALAELLPSGFRHNEQSLRVVERLENGKGLNLTWEVRDGILKHTGKELPLTLEGQVVRIADRFAYINHDIDDALRAGIISNEFLPAEEMKFLGNNYSERLNTMICDLIENSRGQRIIKMSTELAEVMQRLREFMFENVYIGSEAKTEEKKVKGVIKQLYFYLQENSHFIPEEYRAHEPDLQLAIADYIAGMTDRFIIKKYTEFFVPRPWNL